MASWYLETGKVDGDIVVSSRIRLARNIKGIPFETKATDRQKQEILGKVKYITPSIGYGMQYFSMKDRDDITKMSFVEKHLISPEMALRKDQENIGILLNKEENICIMLNEEDHLRLQVFSSGLELQNTMQLAIEIEEKIDEMLPFSCSKEYGYLTACPTNVGTGLRASVMVHLPALKLTGNISKILHIVNNFGMTIRGVYGEDTKSQGDMYQISNNQTLGITEKEIITNLENITKKVVEQERLARKYLKKEPIELQDRVYRAFGILRYATKLNSEEAEDLLSDIKLGTDLGIIEELTDSKVKELELYLKPANLQKRVGKALTGFDRDLERAKVVKQIIG